MSRVSQNKLKKAGKEKAQSKLLDHNFGNNTTQTNSIESTKRKRKRSKKGKDCVPSPEQPSKKPLVEMAEGNAENGNGSCTKDLTEEQMKLHKAITQAIRSTNQEDLTKLLSPITRDISILINLKETIEQQTTEIQNIKLENNVLKQKCSQMEAEQDQLKLRVSVLENAKLEKNAIFYGLEESQWESDQDLMTTIYNYMAMTVKGDESTADKLAKVKKFKILEVARLGPKSDHRTRLVRVTYENSNTVNILLANKKGLPTGIFVDREYSAETTKNRRIMRPYYNAARKSTEFQKKCRMEGDALILNGTKYTVKNLHDLPEQLSGFCVGSRSDTETYAYFGDMNPFSNFYPSPFTYNGITYNHSEQFIQSEKAKLFEDETINQQIMMAENGLECKKLSKNIKNYRHEAWKQAAMERCEPGITAKFMQNPKLIRLLQSTEDKLIVEASRDPVWGTGISITDKDVLTREKWSGHGIMSKILMRLRNKLRSGEGAGGEAGGEPMEAAGPT